MKSMKLIMEGFKQFIKESADDFFGANFVSFKQDTAKGMNVVTAAKKAFGEPIGVGSTRMVFDMGGDFVIKVIKIAEGRVTPEDEEDAGTGFNIGQKRKANQYEKDLKIQMNFPEVFPRSYESADDFSWVVLEKVKPFVNGADFMKYLGYEGEVKKEFLEKSRKAAFKFVDDKSKGIESLTVEMLSEGSTVEKTQTYNKIYDPNNPTFAVDFDAEDKSVVKEPEDYKKFKFKYDYDMLSPDMQMAKKMIENEQLYKIISTCILMGIPDRELKGANIGLSQITGKLVMLDMSLWN